MDGETVEFSPVGTVAGLCGTWEYESGGFRLTWSMGNGKITATNECDNGLSATTEASASFENILEIEQAAEKTVQDDFGLECSVSIEKCSISYYFKDADTLVFQDQGQEMEFQRN